ncbi:MAG: hypothetical protein ACYTGS_04005 [Planctomycetota bacterium]
MTDFLLFIKMMNTCFRAELERLDVREDMKRPSATILALSFVTLLAFRSYPAAAMEAGRRLFRAMVLFRPRFMRRTMKRRGNELS